MMKPFLLRTAIAAGALIASGTSAVAQGEADTVSAPLATARALALYADGPAALTESRPLRLEEPAGAVRMGDLPASADGASLTARLVLDDGTVRVPAALALQEAETDGPSLLRRLIGHEIEWLVRDPASGAEETLTGTLKGVTDGQPLVLREGGLEVLPPGRLRLAPVPSDLVLTRTATAEVDLPVGDSTLLLRYDVAGLRWEARYDLRLGADGESVHFAGDALMHNRSQSDIPPATVSLVAGDVPREGGGAPPQPKMETMAMRSVSADAAGSPPAREATGDRQVYRLDAPVALPAGSHVRRPLIAPAAVPAERRYVLEGQGDAWPGRPGSTGETLRPRVELSFENAADGPLGVPLPAGLVTVRAAEQGTALPPLLLAERRLPTVAVGERVTLDLGAAFDVTAERRLAGFDWRGSEDRRDGRRAYTATHEITLSNAKEQAVTVDLVERFSDVWSVTESSHSIERVDARTARFRVTVPAGGTATLTYGVDVGETDE